MVRPKSEILTPWELKLLKIIWKKGKDVTAIDICSELKKQGLPRSNSAIRKTLRILVEKGSLAYKKNGRQFLYYALVHQEDVTNDCIQYLSRLLFGGSLYQLAVNLFNENELTDEFLQEMKKKLKSEE